MCENSQEIQEILTIYRKMKNNQRAKVKLNVITSYKSLQVTQFIKQPIDRTSAYSYYIS